MTDYQPDFDIVDAPPVAVPDRRLDLVDRALRVVLRGSDVTDLAPAAGVSLEPPLVAELAPLVGTLDATRNPVICGLIGDSHVWRATSFGDSEYVGVIVERSDLGRKIAEFAKSHALGAAEAKLLRLTAGGYSVEETSRRLGVPAKVVEIDRRALAHRMGFASVGSLVLGIASDPHGETQASVSA